MEKKVNSIYEEAYSDISKKWNKFMKSHYPKLKDAQEQLKKAELTGDTDEIKKAKDLYERTAMNITINNRRYRGMVDDTTKKIAHTNEIALAYINNQLPEIYTINYNAFGEEKIKGYSFSLVNESAIKELATKDKTLLPTKKLDIPKDMRWNAKNINSQMLQGILQGESIPDMAKRLRNVTDMNQASAIRNARTMTTAAENKGKQDSYKKASDDGVIMKRIWVATPDERTRAWHADLNGVEVDVDEPWENEYGEIMEPGDPSADPANVYNCRCTMRAHVKGFAWSQDRIDEVKEEMSDLEKAYKDNVANMSKSDVRDAFIDKDSYVNDPEYKNAISVRSVTIEEQKNIVEKINKLESDLKAQEAVPKPRDEWTAEDMMKSILGKTPMIQSEESLKLEKEIDDLWKKHNGFSGIVSKSNDYVEKMDKKNHFEQIKEWHSSKPQVSTNTHFEGFSTHMSIAQYDEDLAKGIGYIAEMSPREYLERCAYDIFENATYESTVLGAQPASILKYAKEMSKGVEFNMGYLDYNDQKQEGRHRAMAAELLGIETIPVYIRGY